MKSSALKASIYEALEIAPPTNRISRMVRRGTILLVGLNTLALLLSFVDDFRPNQPLLQGWLDAIKPHQILILGLIETVSAAFFIAEYLLRLWSAPAGPRFRGRIRFGLRPLLLIDLAAFLPFVVALFAPSRELTLSLLRLGWALRHLKLIRYLWPKPVIDESREALLSEGAARLSQIRQEAAKHREHDLSQVNQHIETISRLCHDAAAHLQQRPAEASQAPSPLAQLSASADSPLLGLIDDLEAALTDPSRTKIVSQHVVAAYEQSAQTFRDTPLRAKTDVMLASDGPIGQKPVPLRRIGRRHFAPLSSRHADLVGPRRPMYVADIQRDLQRIRTSMATALAQSGTQAGTVGLNRAVNELRDLDTPVRLAWDNFIFRLEEDHRTGLGLMRLDIDRHGGLLFFGNSVWRWLLRRLRVLRRLLDIPKRLWFSIQRLCRQGMALIYRWLHPFLQRLGLVKTPTLELLRALDEAHLDTVAEFGLPADYLAHFDFDALTEEEQFFELDAEFADLNVAIERWREQKQSSFIVYGHRGTGKSTLLNIVRERLFAEVSIAHETLIQKLTTTAGLTYYLSMRLGHPEAKSFEALGEALLEGPQRVILLEDCHHLFFRTIGGLDAIRRLFWLIASTNHHILWGISLEKRGYEFLNQALPLSDLFHVQISLETRSGADLRRLIMLRHNRSTYGLHYAHEKRNEKALRRQLKALRKQGRLGRNNLQEALELTYFSELAAACDGNILVAMFYWLRALRVQGEDRFDVLPFDELNLSLIWDLSQDEAFTLVAFLQHGKLTAEELAQILDADEIDIRLELEILGSIR